jgi:hypothetical protein
LKIWGSDLRNDPEETDQPDETDQPGETVQLVPKTGQIFSCNKNVLMQSSEVFER